MEVFTAVTGFKELDDALSYLRDKSSKRMGKSALRRMSAVVAKGIRRFVPKQLQPNQPDKGIGNRMVKRMLQAKAGVAVGKSGRMLKVVQRGHGSTRMESTVNGQGVLRIRERGKKFVRFTRTGRKGVGISVANLHWFALGTKDRYTGQQSVQQINQMRSGKKLVNRRGQYVTKKTGGKVHYTGRIDKAKFGGFVQRGVNASLSEARAEAAKTINKMIDAEAKAARTGGTPVYVEMPIDVD